MLSIAEVIKRASLARRYKDIPYSTMQDAHCPDACVEPHGGGYTSRFFP